ncbi:MAG: CoA-binding protein, partial [Desulfomonilia bacterium]
VYGIRVYRDVMDVKGTISLAVIITSYRYVPQILEDCAKRGIISVIVVSDGFGENGDEGKKRERELIDSAHRAGMRIIGPNTLGVYNPDSGFSTIPYEKGYVRPVQGVLSIITQTGMYGPQAIALDEYRFGISKIIDLGNMCDVDETECLEYLGQDPHTRVISCYLEHIRNPRRFLDVARQVSRDKPILCLKGGKTLASAQALASHTGSMAGDDALYEALFRQAGIIRVEEYEDLLEYAKVFTLDHLPAGNRLGIISLTGAIGIQCIDAASLSGLSLGVLSPESRRRLSELNHTLGGHPIDLGPASAMAGMDMLIFYTRCFDILMEDKNIDCIYLNLYTSSYLSSDFYSEFLHHMREHMNKPVVAWAYGSSSESLHKIRGAMENLGIPFLPTTFKAIRSLGHLVQYAAWQRTVQD